MRSTFSYILTESAFCFQLRTGFVWNHLDQQRMELFKHVLKNGVGIFTYSFCLE